AGDPPEPVQLLGRLARFDRRGRGVVPAEGTDELTRLGVAALRVVVVAQRVGFGGGRQQQRLQAVGEPAEVPLPAGWKVGERRGPCGCHEVPVGMKVNSSWSPLTSKA